MGLQKSQVTIQHQFDAFCKIVLRNEARDYYREITRRKKREVVFSEMSQHESAQLSIDDEYPSDVFTYYVFGYPVSVENELLAKALDTLSYERRIIVLAYYFLGIRDAEIGETLHLNRGTVNYKRLRAFEELKHQMGG